jgi:hypothetical protein
MTQQEIDELLGPQPVFKSGGNQQIQEKLKQNG